MGRRDRLHRGRRGVLRPRRPAGADHNAPRAAAGGGFFGGYDPADRGADRGAGAASDGGVGANQFGGTMFSWLGTKKSRPELRANEAHPTPMSSSTCRYGLPV